MSNIFVAFVFNGEGHIRNYKYLVLRGSCLFFTRPLVLLISHLCSALSSYHWRPQHLIQENVCSNSDTRKKITTKGLSHPSTYYQVSVDAHTQGFLAGLLTSINQPSGKGFWLGQRRQQSCRLDQKTPGR